MILVALMVLLVPELLTGPIRSAPRAAAVAPSAEEPPLRSYTINLADDTHSRSAAATASGPQQPRSLSVAQPAAAESPVIESARNRFPGIVTQVEKDGLVAVVHIQAGPHRITSMMTREAADELGIEPGDLAVGVVKSTNVVVEVPRPE